MRRGGRGWHTIGPARTAFPRRARTMRTASLLLPAALTASLLVPACQTVPGTGRTQFNLVPLGQQIQMGEQAYEEMLADATIITSGPDYEMVQRVGRRIAAAAADLYPDPARAFDWEFRLVQDDEMVNAWALPGGKCAVYTGLLPVTRDEAGLAVVLGHEAAHAIAQHGAERITQGMGLQIGLEVVETYLGRSDRMSPAARQSLMAALGLGANVGVLLPFSRKHESEADELGLYIAARAGYDPQAAIGLWQRMAALGGGRPPEFLSTHPSEETRIRRLQRAMPRALEYYRQAQAEQGGPTR